LSPWFANEANAPNLSQDGANAGFDLSRPKDFLEGEMNERGADERVIPLRDRIKALRPRSRRL